MAEIRRNNREVTDVYFRRYGNGKTLLGLGLHSKGTIIGCTRLRWTTRPAFVNTLFPVTRSPASYLLNRIGNLKYVIIFVYVCFIPSKIKRTLSSDFKPRPTLFNTYTVKTVVFYGHLLSQYGYFLLKSPYWDKKCPENTTVFTV